MTGFASIFATGVLRVGWVLMAPLLLAGCLITTPGGSIGAREKIAEYQKQLADYDRVLADYRKFVEQQERVSRDLRAIKAQHIEVVDGKAKVKDMAGLQDDMNRTHTLATAGGIRGADYHNLPPDVQKQVDSFESPFAARNWVQGTLLGLSGGNPVAQVNTEITRSDEYVRNLKNLVSQLEQQRAAVRIRLDSAEASLRPTTNVNQVAPSGGAEGGRGGGGEGGGGGGGGGGD